MQADLAYDRPGTCNHLRLISEVPHEVQTFQMEESWKMNVKGVTLQAVSIFPSNPLTRANLMNVSLISFFVVYRKNCAVNPSWTMSNCLLDDLVQPIEVELAECLSRLLVAGKISPTIGRVAEAQH